MASDLINFDIIEGQKENIQALPSGRSAKKLAELFSPQPLHKPSSDTKTIHDCIRAEYEAEIVAIAESDDPLDVYDRYVRWTLDSYPSAQATPQSQLHILLERATKAFVSAPTYKNDPRYLKIWLHYIRFFSDLPRETFVFLSRHSIGETLALFYEEYAAWLEGAGRWAQAEEVYKLGIEREARPTSRLLRKFDEFDQRRAQLPEAEVGGPSSPALPTVRPALAAKTDPFVAVAAAALRDPQPPRQTSGIGGQAAKPARSKLAIFSDADAVAPALSAAGPGSKGWDNIGSLADRKKENVMEAKPWAGETLKAGGKKSTAPKLAVFRDTSLSKQLSQSHIPIYPYQAQVTVNPANGRKERVFVDLEAVYPDPEEPGAELSFEEIWAANQGWLDHDYEDEVEPQPEPEFEAEAESSQLSAPMMDENSLPDMNVPAKKVSEKLAVHHDVIRLDENGAPIYPRENKPRKKKVIEVNETQIIKAKLDSPSKPKMRKKHSADPTMTLHTKAATDDIYDIFNAPVKPMTGESDDEHGYDTDDYTSGAESTGTTRNVSTSEAGDEDGEAEENPDEEMSDVKSISEWSDFSTRKHIPNLVAGGDEEQNDTQVSDLIDIHDDEVEGTASERTDQQNEHSEDEEDEEDGVVTPVSDGLPSTRTSFVPIPPEDYVPSRRPFRDPVEAANNRLPFMTPITERTESSLDITSDQSDIHAKTPCKKDDGRKFTEDEDSLELDPLSSPLREVIEEEQAKGKVSQPLLPKAKAPIAILADKALAPKALAPKALAPTALAPKALAPKALAPRALAPKGPIVNDAQCNPVDDSVRAEILANIQPSLNSHEGFFDHRTERYEKGAEVRKFIKTISKGNRQSTDRTLSLASAVLQFPDTETQYTIRKELGAGAFAPVYLVENSAPNDSSSSSRENNENDENASGGIAIMGRRAFASAHNHRHEREALKMEQPPTPWEFYMMRLAHTRLGPYHRATASLSPALEMHLYQDDGFLFLPFFPHGTLLDVVNLFRAEPSGVMDELLAMFFSVELLRTVEALHAKQMLHGDIKADNCLLRLDGNSIGGQQPPGELNSQWRADGAGGWAARGVTLIDFGRAIDMRAFVPDVQFIADWKTTAQDCAEMREGRPWTWQIDYHGLAGTIHCLLFGKYIETVRCDAGGLGLGRKYKIRESLKRYWQTEIWAECFDVLLNPGSFVQHEDGGRMPVLKSMRGVRERMEVWLEANGERGVGLRSLMGKVEAWSRGRR
ncbi:Mad3/BUB1 homology region 1-domain-containing protein [Lasiosphaeris hirsuta]|uniref:Mad3/BUB1 homology region 1-domain-containing protein n=1 Tax=Lasiosphaeris hirsuta TaxID=260670 RepID=A0AA40BCT7_9PEZI|nr:Mad3/BUB1 homology region 1-domain-containing protein [Lasiosphaeris hirsuta]